LNAPNSFVASIMVPPRRPMPAGLSKTTRRGAAPICSNARLNSWQTHSAVSHRYTCTKRMLENGKVPPVCAGSAGWSRPARIDQWPRRAIPGLGGSAGHPNLRAISSTSTPWGSNLLIFLPAYPQLPFLPGFRSIWSRSIRTIGFAKLPDWVIHFAKYK
jgi:hypothetical protein